MHVYLALYALAILLMVLNCYIPAVVCAVAAHGYAHRDGIKRVAVKRPAPLPF